MHCCFRALTVLIGTLLSFNASSQDPDILGINFGSPLDDAKTLITRNHDGIEFHEVMNAQTRQINNLFAFMQDTDNRVHGFVLSITPENDVWGIQRIVKYPSGSQPHIDSVISHFDKYGGIPNDTPRVGYGGAQNVNYMWMEFADGTKLSGAQGYLYRSKNRELKQCDPQYHGPSEYAVGRVMVKPEYPTYVSPNCRIFYNARILANHEGLVSEVMIRGVEHSRHYELLQANRSSQNEQALSHQEKRLEEAKKVDPGL